jgi:hypothetical protein
MEETLEGGRGPPRAVVPLERERERERERESVVGIVTRYGMDGSGLDPRWTQEFSLLRTRPDWLRGQPIVP